MELALESVFNNLSGSTAQTAVAMFKRFQQRWPTSTEEGQVATAHIFDAHTGSLRAKVVKIYQLV